MVNLDGAAGFVSVALVYDAFRVGCDGVVNKDVHVVFGTQQGDNVAVQRKVRLHAAFDFLAHFRVGLVHQLPHLAANGSLPIGQGINVIINSGVDAVSIHAIYDITIETGVDRVLAFD